ncbi:MAG: DJ-1/PfpI family protein [Phaeodactylibacter sp.]|nr:DJ-1/PfpI family protein [Phaeodactylibacter sp.]
MRSILFFPILLAAVHTYGQEPTEEAPISIVYTCAPCGCELDGQQFEAMGVCPSCNMPLRPTLIGIDLKTRSVERPKVGIFLFNGADIMDVTGPLSVFEHAHFTIATFAQQATPVRIGRNIELQPEFTFENLPQMDVLVFPGGGMAETDPGNPEILQFIQSRKDSTEVLFSVCSGAFFLGEAGLLDGQAATTFAALLPDLEADFPEAHVLNYVKYTDNGQIVTSSGLSSGMDAAFQVVAKFRGAGRAQDVANHMEYDWTAPFDYARSQLADNYLFGMRSLLGLFARAFPYSKGDQNRWEYRLELTSQLSSRKIMELLRGELNKLPDWEMKTTAPTRIEGYVQHPVLGKGLVCLQLNEEEALLIVTAERLQPYIPKSQGQ